MANNVTINIYQSEIKSENNSIKHSDRYSSKYDDEQILDFVKEWLISTSPLFFTIKHYYDDKNNCETIVMFRSDDWKDSMIKYSEYYKKDTFTIVGNETISLHDFKLIFSNGQLISFQRYYSKEVEDWHDETI